MNMAFRLMVLPTLLLVLTGADTALSAAGLLPIPAVALSLALLLMAAFFGAVSVRGRPFPARFRVGTLELVLVFAILQVPTMLGALLITFVPDLAINLGPLALYNLIVSALVLVTCLLIDDEQKLRRLTLACLFLYVLSVVFDLLSGGLLTVLVARPAGFLRNPNDGAFMIAALLVASLRWREPTIRDVWLAGLAFGGIMMTLSRSGLLVWGLITLAYFAAIALAGNFRSRLVLAALVAVMSVAAFLASQTMKALPVTNIDSIRRLSEIGELLSGDVRTAVDDPRVLLFRHYVDLAAERPLTGYGSSFAVSGFGTSEEVQDDQGPHNVFLARYLDTGFLGLAALLMFLLFWFSFFVHNRSPAGYMYVVFLVLAGLFSHDLLDRKALLGVLALLAAQAMLRQQKLRPAYPSIA